MMQTPPGRRLSLEEDFCANVRCKKARACARALGLQREEGSRMETFYFPSTQEKINGATIVASLSTMNLGVFEPNLPQVIFSLGTAPE